VNEHPELAGGAISRTTTDIGSTTDPWPVECVGPKALGWLEARRLPPTGFDMS
jgi:hypothetical protein